MRYASQSHLIGNAPAATASLGHVVLGVPLPEVGALLVNRAP
jgi:hypothetical protein